MCTENISTDFFFSDCLTKAALKLSILTIPWLFFEHVGTDAYALKEKYQIKNKVVVGGTAHPQPNFNKIESVPQHLELLATFWYNLS